MKMKNKFGLSLITKIMIIIVIVSFGLAIGYTISYYHDKKLINDLESQIMSYSEINDYLQNSIDDLIRLNMSSLDGIDVSNLIIELNNVKTLLIAKEQELNQTIKYYKKYYERKSHSSPIPAMSGIY